MVAAIMAVATGNVGGTDSCSSTKRRVVRERERERCGVDVPNGLYSVWYGMTAVKYSE
jgi:hypothetical protein